MFSEQYSHIIVYLHLTTSDTLMMRVNPSKGMRINYEETKRREIKIVRGG